MSAIAPLSLSSPELRSRLVAYARHRVHRDVAEDLVQEVLTQVIERPPPPAVVDSADDLVRWLTIMVRNKAVDHHRRALALRAITATRASHAQDFEPRLEARDALRTVDDALAAPHDRDAAVLGWIVRESEGESLERIAEAESIAAPALRQRIRRFRVRVRALLAVAAAMAAFAVAVAAYRWLRNPTIARDPSAGKTVDVAVLAQRQARYRVVAVDSTNLAVRARLLNAELFVDHGRVYSASDASSPVASVVPVAAVAPASARAGGALRITADGRVYVCAVTDGGGSDPGAELALDCVQEGAPLVAPARVRLRAHE